MMKDIVGSFLKFLNMVMSLLRKPTEDLH